MKEFMNGAQYTINGKVRKVTKVNSKSVYFGKIRFDIQMDEELNTQFIVVDDTVINADDTINQETATEINKEEITMTENTNIVTEEEVIEDAQETTEIATDSQPAIDIINKVEAREAAETAKAEAPKYTEYVVMKADQKDTTLWWDIVRKAKGENISDIINPLHEDDNPKFVALVALDKVKKYLGDTTIKGMVQTVRDVTKKYAKVSSIENPTEALAATVFEAIVNALAEGAQHGSWNAIPTAPVEDVVTEEDDIEEDAIEEDAA